MTDTVERMLPLYQGVMIAHYDHRAADVIRSETALKRQNQPRYLSDAEKADPKRFPIPMYWVREELVDSSEPWRLAFCDVTSATNERTLVPAAIPAYGSNHKVPLIRVTAPNLDRLALLAVMSSIAFDYLVRQKLGGTSMTYFYLRQMPTPSPTYLQQTCPFKQTSSWTAWLAAKAIYLVSTSEDMRDALAEGGADADIFRWDPKARRAVRAEMDAACFHLYGVDRDDVDYIMETFPIVKRKDVAEFGDFRTRRMILEVYDAMADAIRTGIPYSSPFDAAGEVSADA